MKIKESKINQVLLDYEVQRLWSQISILNCGSTMECDELMKFTTEIRQIPWLIHKHSSVICKELTSQCK